jgi:hypothetical protein
LSNEFDEIKLNDILNEIIQIEELKNKVILQIPKIFKECFSDFFGDFDKKTILKSVNTFVDHKSKKFEIITKIINGEISNFDIVFK